jgi:transposase-like protein
MPKRKPAVARPDGIYVPRTLQEAVVYFADADAAFEYATARRWPDGVRCPLCDTPEPSFIASRKIWRCKGCKKQFSVRVGTIFEDSPISLGKWYMTIWMLTNCKNGVSSYEIHRAIGVTQKTAWFMLHRVRAAIKAKSFDKKLAGIVETDECFIGGLFKNMHDSKREEIRAANTPNKRGGIGKTIVQAVLERGGEVRAKVINDLTLDTRLGYLQENAEAGSKLMSDEASDSPQVDAVFEHEFVNHKVEYVRGDVHCNGVENFWALLQRTLSGTYVSVEPFHLGAYVDEQTFRFNARKDDDGGRFLTASAMVPTARLTYKELIAAEA